MDEESLAFLDLMSNNLINNVKEDKKFEYKNEDESDDTITKDTDNISNTNYLPHTTAEDKREVKKLMA